MEDYERANKIREYYQDKKILIRAPEYEYREIFGSNNLMFIKEGYNDWAKKEKPSGTFRIMTWNVHYWTDVNEIETMEDTAETITKINADVVTLQEATFGSTVFTDVETNSSTNQKMVLTKSIQSLLPEYILISFCNTLPMWYHSPYGNAILIKKYVYENTHLISSLLCDNVRCHFAQFNKVFEYPLRIIQDTSQGLETRCFIKISFPDFDIFSVHLSVENAYYRLKQLEEISNNIKRKSIIIGDFNFVTELDFSGNNDAMEFWKYYTEHLYQKYGIKITDRERKLIKEKGWKDSFEILGKTPLNYSQWTGTRVDYVFFTNEWKREEINNSYFYFTNESDHTPLIVDINYDRYQNIPKKDIKSNVSEPIAIDSKTMVKMMLPDMQEDTMFNGKIKQNTELTDSDVKRIISEMRIYNGQAINAKSWYTYDPTQGYTVSYDYVFEDPYLTSTSTKILDFGRNGMYATTQAQTACEDYGIKFTNDLVRNGILPNNYDNTCCLFVFRLKNIKDAKILLLPRKSLYKPIYDQHYDIITSGIYTLKITEKNYDTVQRKHKFIELENMYVCSQYCDKHYYVNVINNMISAIKYVTDNDSYYNKLISKYQNEISEVENGDKEPIPIYSYESTYNCSLIIEKIKHPLQPLTGSGYLKKYIKYKQKYLQLKNT